MVRGTPPPPLGRLWRRRTDRRGNNRYIAAERGSLSCRAAVSPPGILPLLQEQPKEVVSLGGHFDGCRLVRSDGGHPFLGGRPVEGPSSSLSEIRGKPRKGGAGRGVLPMLRTTPPPLAAHPSSRVSLAPLLPSGAEHHRNRRAHGRDRHERDHQQHLPKHHDHARVVDDHQQGEDRREQDDGHSCARRPACSPAPGRHSASPQPRPRPSSSGVRSGRA